MAKKQQTTKRRVAAAEQAARQQAAIAKAERRRRLLVGGVVGFLALALIAPLTAGLIANDDPDPQTATTTTAPLDLPWAAGEQAGATITGPTPCPATDGSETRTTEFAEAPPLCIEPGAAYDLAFDTEVGSFTVPIDSGVNEDVANLAAVLAWYRAYEQTPVISATGGLLRVGSQGDAGFTINTALPTGPVNELYPIGSVVAIPAIDGGVNGALMVVLDEPGRLLLQSDPRYVPVGMIDDLSEHQAVYDSPESDTTLVVDTVTVTSTPPEQTVTVAPFDPALVDWVYPEFDTEISDDCPPADGSAERTIDFDGPQPTCIDATASYTAVFDTSEGEIRVDLDTATTPGTVNNFVTLARHGYYDGTTIFRTDPSIDIIQGGAPHTESASDRGPGYTIVDEPTFDVSTGQLRGPYTYEAGQLVMARSSGPDSSGAQFFFVTGPLASLLDSQGTYIVFGNTDDAGIEVLQSIIGLHEDDPTSGLGGAPSREVTVNSVTILEA